MAKFKVVVRHSPELIASSRENTGNEKNSIVPSLIETVRHIKFALMKQNNVHKSK